MASSGKSGKWLFFGVIALIGLWFVGGLVLAWMQRDREERQSRTYADLESGRKLYATAIRVSDSKPWIDSGKKDAKGNAVMISCGTCHDTRNPDFTNNDASKLDEFHQGLKYAHGSQTCLSCHNPDDYNTLKRADGQRLDFNQSMLLCAQCHGPQYRDYQNGSHGGMTGHWDLRQGPRERNSCTDCHDPHHPAYPEVMPVFPPKPVIGEVKLPPHGSPHH
jgi:cytochrome c553